MSQAHSRHVIVAVVSPFDKSRQLPVNVVMAAFTSVFLTAWGETAIHRLADGAADFEAAVFVEGRRHMTDFHGIHIISMPIELIDEVAETYLALAKKGEAKKDTTANLMIVALGSPVYCQDVVRFAALDRKGQVSSEINPFTDRIARANGGDVLWTDTMTNDQVHEGNLLKMFGEAKRRGIIGD